MVELYEKSVINEKSLKKIADLNKNNIVLLIETTSTL